MYHIGRVFISNLGHASAFYRGNIFTLDSSFAQGPSHNLFVATNGGGKTTLLSMVFSVFEPHVRQFVQTIQRKDHKFADYLSDRPGLIAVELVETDSLAPGRRVVGWVHTENQRKEQSRQFFSFRVTAKKRLEMLPWEGGAVPADMVVRNWQGVQEWVRAWKQLSEGDVGMQTFDSQEAWKRHLREEVGLKLDLITSQIQLAKTEGGLAKLFEETNTDDKCLELMCDLMGMREYADALIEEVKTGAREMSLSDAIRKEAAAYRAIGEEMEAAFEAETARAAAEGRSDAAKAELRSFGAALKWEIEGLRDRVGFLKAEVEELDGHADREMRDAKSGRADAEGWRVAAAGKRREAAARALDVASAELREARSEERAIALSGRMAHLNTSEKAHKTKQAAFEDAQRQHEDELRPVREAGSLLRAALGSVAGKLDRISVDMRSEADRIRNDGSVAQLEQVDLKAEEKQAKEQARSRMEFQGKLDGRRAELSASGLLLEDEPLDSARQRLETEAEQALAQRDLAKDVLAEASGAASMRERDLKDSEAALSSAAGNLKIASASLAQRDSMLRGFRENEDVLRVFEGDGPDPLSADAGASAARRVKQSEDDKAAVEMKLRSREASLRAFDEGLSSDDASMRRALDRIRSLGVEAHAAPDYLSKSVPEAEKAKQIVEAAPGRMFYGILVNDSRSLETVRDADHSDWNLVEPIEVSVINHDVAPARGYEHCILPPMSAAAYHLPTRKKEIAELRAEIADMSKKAAQADELLHAAKRAQRHLDGILSAEEQVSHATLLKRFEDAETALGEADETVSLAGAALAEAQASRVTAKDEAERMEGEAKAAAERMKDFRTARDEIRSVEARLEGLPSAMDIARRLAELSMLVADKQKEIDGAEERARRKFDEASNLYQKQRNYREEQVRYQLGWDETAHLEGREFAESDLPSLREAYRTHESKARDGDAFFERTVADITVSSERLEGERQQFQVERDGAARTLGLSMTEEDGFDKLIEKHARAEAVDRTSVAHAAAERIADLAARQESAVRDEQAARENEKVLRIDQLDALIVDNAVQRIAAEAVGKPEGECLAAMEAAIALHQECQERERGFRKERAAKGVELDGAKERLSDLDGESKRVLKADLLSIAPARGDIPADRAGLEAASQRLIKAVDDAAYNLSRLTRKMAEIRTRFSRTAVTVMAENKGTYAESMVARLKSAADAEGQPWRITEDEVRRVREAEKTSLSKLEKLEPQRAEIVRRLTSALSHSVSLLKKAVRVKVPEAAGRFGGAQIIKCGMPLAQVQDENCRMAAKVFLDELVTKYGHSGDGVRIDGLHLSVSLLKELARQMGHEEYGFRILSPVVQSQENTFHKMAGMIGSGGQVLTSAFLLYLVIAACRAGGNAGSVFLLLDNPLGVASAKDLVETQVAVANQLNIQIVAVSAITPDETILCFDKITELRLNRGRKAAFVQPEEVEKSVWSASYDIEIGKGRAVH